MVPESNLSNFHIRIPYWELFCLKSYPSENEMRPSEAASLYRGILAEHATHIKDHYNGLDKDGSLLPSMLRPSSYWSPEEKQQFFLGLNRFSRLRPDLIADTIGSKTTAEVCEYLSSLARASHERGPALKYRNKLPAAREVSDDWLSFECTMADSSATRDVILERSYIGRSRRIECTNFGMMPKNVLVGQVFKKIRRIARKRKRSISDIMSLPEDSDGDESDGDNGEPPLKLTKLEHSWVREDLLRDLDKERLSVLDKLLDDAELAEVSEEDDRAIDEEPGDLSQTVTTDHLHPDRGDLAASQLASLTPLERTRYRKRMYMRRKRAKEQAAARSEDIRNITVNKSITKLQAGRKKTKTTEAPTFDDQRLDHEVDNEEEGKEKPSLRPRRALKFQHIKLVLKCTGFTANDLVADGLDLFHHSRLGNLMRTYSRSHVNPDDHVFLRTSMSFRPNKAGTSLPVPAVRYTTLQLLRAYIKSYLDLLISRSIIVATAERDAKQRTKVWRGKQNMISTANVRKATRLVKGAYLPRKDFIRQLPSRLNLMVSGDTTGSAGDAVDYSISERTSSGEPNLFEDISGVFFLLPLSLQRPGPDFEDEMEHFLRNDGLESTLPESELLPNRDDTAKLWKIMRQEEELDAKDRERDVEHERELSEVFQWDFKKLEEVVKNGDHDGGDGEAEGDSDRVNTYARTRSSRPGLR